jgi:predicted lipoprotein with Yx(FWY)xxD motif
MTFKSPVLFIASAALALLVGCASMSSAPAKMADGVLVGPNGMTLYTMPVRFIAKNALGLEKST